MTCFFNNCVFKNNMFLLFLRIYDAIKNIMRPYFFINCVSKNDIFLLFSRIRNFIKIIVMTCFLLIAYLKMTCLCIFHNVVFIYPTIKIT